MRTTALLHAFFHELREKHDVRESKTLVQPIRTAEPL